MTQTEQTLKDQLTEARNDYENEKKSSFRFCETSGALEYFSDNYVKAYANYFANLAKENENT